MLTERQVRALLTRCESAARLPLGTIRANLLQRDPTPFIWELVVLDALQALAFVEYEVPTPTGKKPDFRVGRLVTQSLWVEAAYVEDRFVEYERQRDALVARLAKEEQKWEIPVGSVDWEIMGEETAAGQIQVLPAQQDLKRFFAQPLLREFFRKAAAQPQVAVTCDLHPEGYTLRLTYSPKGARPQTRSGHCLVADAPTKVSEHVVFRTLREKGRKAKEAEVREPYVVCIGSERSPSMTAGRSARVVTREQAAYEAFREYPVISAAFLVPIELGHPDHPSRRARPAFLVNPGPLYPLAPVDLEKLAAIDFNRWEYGPAWNEWSGALPGASRRGRIGGTLTISGGKKPNHLRVELPVKFVAQLLAGEVDAEAISREYRLGPEHGVLNPFQSWLAQSRSIVDVQFIDTNPTDRQPPRIAFEYGPPEEPVLQKKKRKE